MGYRLEVDPLDLGSDMRAVGLELLDPADGEPLRGAEAADVWSRVLPALAGGEPWALDFFSHLERVRPFCRDHNISFRESAGKGLIIPGGGPEALAPLFDRFAGETFGARAGGAVATGDAEVEINLRRQGVDAYHHAYPRYLFCAVCDFGTGSLTLLSDRLWASEVIRRSRPALAELEVEVALSG